MASALTHGWARALPHSVAAATRALLTAPVAPLLALAPPGVGAATTAASGSLCARLGALCYGLYGAWWLCFPAESLPRRDWRPSLLPDRPPVRSLGSWLLLRLRVAAPEPAGESLVAATSVASVREQPLGVWDAKIGHGFPSAVCRLSPVAGDEDALDLPAPLGRSRADPPSPSGATAPSRHAQAPSPLQALELFDLLHKESFDDDAAALAAPDWREDAEAALAAARAAAATGRTEVFRAEDYLAGVPDADRMNEVQKLRFQLMAWASKPNPKYENKRLKLKVDLGRDTPLEAGQEAPGALGLGDRAGPEVADTLGGDDGWTLAGPDVTV